MYKIIFILYTVTFVLLCITCKQEVPAIYHSTWQSDGMDEPRFALPNVQEELGKQSWPVAGTASHHLLTAKLIDDYFKQLRASRSIKTFFILSPSHWGRSVAEFSFSSRPWKVGNQKLIYADTNIVHALETKLNVVEEANIFDGEHGVSTLIPYIARYFPKAKVVPIAYAGEPPVNMPRAEKLAAALLPYFASEQDQRANFLLVSSDFSHHEGVAATARKDGYSAQFFAAPSMDNWILVGCDNRPAIYVFARLLDMLQKNGEQTKTTVRFHTDAYQLSGQAVDDITSYFFTYLSVVKK